MMQLPTCRHHDMRPAHARRVVMGRRPAPIVFEAGLPDAMLGKVRSVRPLAGSGVASRGGPALPSRATFRRLLESD